MMRNVIKSNNDKDTFYLVLECGHSTPNLSGYHSINDFNQKLWCEVCNRIELNKNLNNIQNTQYNPQYKDSLWVDKPNPKISIFTQLLHDMQVIHDKKKHDYTGNDDPYGNYRFAGKLSKLFNNPDDAGFVGRIGEKLYRLANLDNSGKTAVNETVEDTEVDICTIVVLWMASRKERRIKGVNNGPHMETTGR